METDVRTYLGQLLKAVKGTLSGAATLLVATADAVTNTLMTHVVGNKTDAAVTTVGTTKSLMGYLKGCLSLLVHGTYGLSALKTLIDTLTTNLSTTDGKVDTLTTNVGTVDTVVDRIEVDTTSIETKVDTLTTNLSTTDGKVDGIVTRTTTAEYTTALNYLDAGGEQTLWEDTGGTTRKEVLSAWADTETLTQNGSFKVYVKIDGTNYRLWKTVSFTVATDGAINVLAGIGPVAYNTDFKITYTEDGDEGADRSIPCLVIYRTIE